MRELVRPAAGGTEGSLPACPTPYAHPYIQAIYITSVYLYHAMACTKDYQITNYSHLPQYLPRFVLSKYMVV